jgi:hypothetical protein
MLMTQEIKSSSPSSPIMMNDLEKHANDPLQVLATQSSKRVSFEEENLKKVSQQLMEQDPDSERPVVVEKKTQERTAMIEEEEEPQQPRNATNTAITAITSHLHNTDEVMETSNWNPDQDDTSEGVYTPKENDILSGRGAGVNLHPGNVFFRKLIQANKKRYVQADPGEKKRIIRRIVEATEAKGRFLKQDPKSELWTRISTEEARKKTGQALRENAPAIKREQDELKKKKYELAALSALPGILSQGNRLDELNSLSSSLSSPSSLAPSLVSPPSCESIEARIEEARFLKAKQLQRQQQKQRQQQLLHSTNPNHMLLWTRMNILQEKQEQLKRKQRELEDEQSQLMQYLYQMSAVAAATGSNSSLGNTAAVASSSNVNRSTHAVNMNPGLFTVNSSDSDSDSIYGRIAKKRRLMIH